MALHSIFPNDTLGASIVGNCGRRYEKAQKSAQDFQTDVEGYKKMKEQVLAEPSVECIGSIQVESHQIKQVSTALHLLDVVPAHDQDHTHVLVCTPYKD